MQLTTMPAEVYHADPCSTPSLSQSMARTLLTSSPLHAYRAHPKLGGVSRKATKSMDNGTVIHDLLLNGGTLEGIVVLPYDDYRKKDAQADRDAVIASGRIPVKQADYDELVGAAGYIATRLASMDITFPGQTEGVLTWDERADCGTIVRCRARIDHWLAPQIDDLKTTQSAHPKAIVRSMIDHGYDIQAAAYLSGIEKKFPELAGRAAFRFLFVETVEPFLVTPVVPSGSMLALGRSKWRRAINLWAKCLNTNTWPGYVEGTYTAYATNWALQDEMEQDGADRTLINEIEV